jgi:WD40 repeat protein
LEAGGAKTIPLRGNQYFDTVVNLAWSPDGKLFALTPSGRETIILNAYTWTPIARWRSVGGEAGAITFASDGKLLARLNDGTLQALDVSTLKSVAEE